MLDKLKDLCLLDGISGDEGAVREYIIDKIGDKAEIRVDNLGNVIAFCKGKKTPKNKIMVSAHMDEVGMIVTYVNSDGTLKVSSVGGVDPRVVFGRRVKIGRNNVLGVVGGKAIHNLTAEERKKSVPFDKLTIDIGVDSREEALKLVRLGDSVRFVSDFVEFGEGFVKCKAIDDRAGCAIMLRMIEEGMEYDTYFTFVVQEEIGLRGSTCAAFTVAPDYAVVLESTTAAEENGIPCQTKTMVAGGNDAGAIHVSRGGVKTAAVSLPCRYLHSPSCVINKADFENAYVLTKLILDRTYNK